LWLYGEAIALTLHTLYSPDKK